MSDELPRPGSRKEQTQSALLNAAGELLVQRGYKATRIEDVAKLADRAPATAYVHFPTKPYLVARVVAPVFDPVFAAAQAALETDGPMTAAIIAHVDRLAVTSRDNQPLTAALVEAIQDATIRSGVPASAQDPRSVLPLSAPLGELLRKGQQTGELPEHLPAGEVAAYVTNALMMHLLTRPDSNAHDSAQLTLSLLLPSLRDKDAWNPRV